MKKYNLSNIMKRAWGFVRKLGLSISDGLKKAWTEAKVKKELFKCSAKIQKPGSLGLSASDFLTFSLWAKYGKKRIYINDYKRRTIGYLENGKFIKIDGCGNRQDEIEYTIESFKQNYEISI